MRRRYLATTRLPAGATLMLERELKLDVPEASRIGLKKALTQLGATELALNARYFDTENRDLAKAGIALRLRQEGDQWVQTVKAPGPAELSIGRASCRERVCQYV